MSEAKHTPGQWEFFAKLSGSENHKGYIITNSKGWVLAEVSPIDEDGIEGVANSKLIAAAPDLLNELQHAANMLSAVAGDLEDGVSGLRKYITALFNARDNAMAVIRKATS